MLGIALSIARRRCDCVLAPVRRRGKTTARRGCWRLRRRLGRC